MPFLLSFAIGIEIVSANGSNSGELGSSGTFENRNGKGKSQNHSRNGHNNKQRAPPTTNFLYRLSFALLILLVSFLVFAFLQDMAPLLISDLSFFNSLLLFLHFSLALSLPNSSLPLSFVSLAILSLSLRLFAFVLSSKLLGTGTDQRSKE